MTSLSDASDFDRQAIKLSQTSRRPLTNLSQTSHKPLGDLSQTSHKPLGDLSQTSHKPLGTSRRPRDYHDQFVLLDRESPCAANWPWSTWAYAFGLWLWGPAKLKRARHLILSLLGLFSKLCSSWSIIICQVAAPLVRSMGRAVHGKSMNIKSLGWQMELRSTADALHRQHFVVALFACLISLGLRVCGALLFFSFSCCCPCSYSAFIVRCALLCFQI